MHQQISKSIATQIALTIERVAKQQHKPAFRKSVMDEHGSLLVFNSRTEYNEYLEQREPVRAND